MDFSEIEALVRTLRESDALTEVEVRRGDTALRIRRPAPGSPAPVARSGSNGTKEATPVSSPAPVRPIAPKESLNSTSAVVTITSPLVGVFRARRPHSVQVGDVVSSNELLGQIEAMRLMNDCVATTAGRIQAVFIQDNRPVEYGQPLFEIAPEAIP